MKFLHRNLIKKSQWQTYKELELIPNSLLEPQANNSTFGFGIDQAWRLLVVALTRELIYEQQVEYLERCWVIDCFEHDKVKQYHTWQKFLILIS